MEAARAAGVHLAFFSGNEVFWKTRWESSISTPATSYRTLVSYKETHAGAKIDPTVNVWTGTWEDPRFSPPADGGRPANALTGTLFRVNAGTGALTVPAVEGKQRLWRNTEAATQAAGASLALTPGTLGYEWDEDVTECVSTRRPGQTVEHDALRSRQAAGLRIRRTRPARRITPSPSTGIRAERVVFGAGTVQWSWGLDSHHERGSDAPSLVMQQATVNLFADMGGIQPLTLQAGLVLTTSTTDTVKPTSAITNPTNNSGVPANTFVTVSGTASDVGGAVGAVEFSADGGATWQPATGRENWTFSWQTGTARTATLLSRAVDDSGNLEVPVAGITVNVGAGTAVCPCSIWVPSQGPAGAPDNDAGQVELGTRFRSDSRRLHYGDPLLQGLAERRLPRGQPLDIHGNAPLDRDVLE